MCLSCCVAFSFSVLPKLGHQRNCIRSDRRLKDLQQSVVVCRRQHLFDVGVDDLVLRDSSRKSGWSAQVDLHNLSLVSEVSEEFHTAI